jgi:hypothetical protein
MDLSFNLGVSEYSTVQCPKGYKKDMGLDIRMME